MYTNSTITSNGTIMTLTVEQPEVSAGSNWVTLRWHATNYEEVEVFLGDELVPVYFGTASEFSCEIPDGVTTFRIVAFTAQDDKVAIDGDLFAVLEDEPPFIVTNSESAITAVGSFAWAINKAVSYDGALEDSGVSIETEQAGTSFSVHRAIAVNRNVTVHHHATSVSLKFADALHIEQDGNLTFSAPVVLDGLLTMSGGELTLESGSELQMNSDISHGATLRLFGLEGEGTRISDSGALVNIFKDSTLEIDHLSIANGAQLKMFRGSRIESVYGGTPTIEVMNGLNDGVLVMDGVNLNGAEINCHGHVTLTNCAGMGTINICCGSVTISGCDLSQVTINLLNTNGHDSSNAHIKLSDNYWGTTDMEEIKSKINGYDDSRVTLETPRSEIPAPTLNAPRMLWSWDGFAYVTFSWESVGEYSYEMEINGEHCGWGTPECSATEELADGTYTYTLLVSDDMGNTLRVDGGEFVVDSAALKVELLPVETKKFQDGMTQVTFSWNTVEGHSYELEIDGEVVYSGTDSSFTTILGDDFYSYSLRAGYEQDQTYEAGWGELELDASAPDVEFWRPETFPQEDGRSEVYFSWYANEECTYVLEVNGQVVSTDETAADFSMILEDGVHTYKLTATDMAGNVTVVGEKTLKIGPEASIFDVTLPGMGAPEYLSYKDFNQARCGIRLQLAGGYELDITPCYEGHGMRPDGFWEAEVKLTHTFYEYTEVMARYKITDWQEVNGSSVPRQATMSIDLSFWDSSDIVNFLYGLGVNVAWDAEFSGVSLVVDMLYTEEGRQTTLRLTDEGGNTITTQSGEFNITTSEPAEGSFAWAMNEANFYSGEHPPTIAIDVNSAGNVIELEGEFTIDRDMTITHNGEGSVRLERDRNLVIFGNVNLTSPFELVAPVTITSEMSMAEGSSLKGDVLVEFDHTLRLEGTSTQGCIFMRSGATLICEAGCSLNAREVAPEDAAWDSGGACLVVADGATLVADGLVINGPLALAPGATLEGSIHFAAGSSLRLAEWEGSTSQLWEQVLSGVNWTADGPLNIEIGAALYSDQLAEWVSPFYSDTTLSKLDDRFGAYVTPNETAQLDVPLTLEEGVELTISSVLYAYSPIILEGNNVIHSAEGVTAELQFLYSGPALQASNSRIEVTVCFMDDAYITGENLTFAAKVPFRFELLEWDGNREQLQQSMNYALEDISGYTLEAENPVLSVNTSWLCEEGTDVIFNADTIAAMLPEGYADLHFTSLTFNTANTIRVEAGTTLNFSNIDLTGGAQLIFEEGSGLTDVLRNNPFLYVDGYNGESQLSMTGLDLNGVTIMQSDGGIVQLTGCWGPARIEVDTPSQLQLTGCNLSEVTLVLKRPADGSVYNLSGNYWGTTNLDAIKSMIEGYDESYVTLGEVLTAPPCGEVKDNTPPALTLMPPTTQKLGTNETQVTLSWSSDDAEATYELTVDGDVVYSGTKTTCTFTLADGEHSYSLKATDAAGNAATATGSELVLDTTAPTLTLSAPTLEKEAEGRSLVTLSWSATESATYELTVDGKVVYTGTDAAYTLTLADGEHSWSLKATDAAGNAATTEGSKFVVDTIAPTLTLSAPATEKVAEGSSQVTLSWASDDAAATYELTVDGEVIYTGADTTYTLTLADGTYSWSVTAWDKADNESKATAPELVLNTFAPVLTLSTPAVEKAAEGSSTVTLSWEATGASSCELTVDGKVVYTGTDASYTLTLADGTHSWSVKATNSAGMATTATGSELVLDATAPELYLSTPILTKLGAGRTRVTLSWATGEAATYELTVNGEVVYSGVPNSYTLDLEDGTYSWSVKATDTAGNTATATGSEIVLDATAPTLSLETPEYETVGQGKTKVTLSWASDDTTATYELTVDGKVVYAGADTSYTLTLADGEHSYSVAASDARGNSSSAEGESFTLDTVAPALTLHEPQLGENLNGLTQVTLSWSANESASYELEVNGETVYTGEESSYTIALPDGSYSWSVTARDDADNSATAEGKEFKFDTSAPELTLNELQVKASGKGKAKVTFSWESDDDAATYVLTVDGVDYNLKKATSKTLTLADGEHSWSVTVTDANGNSSTVEAEESFVTDTIAPTMSGLTVEADGSEGSGNILLSWNSNDETATYKVTLDGATDYEATVSEGECLFEGVTDGKYKVTIIATDADGNSSTMKNNISVDFTPPALELKETKIKKNKGGGAQVTLSWKGESKATYIVTLDGEVVYEGTKTSCKLNLADGDYTYSVVAKDASGNKSEELSATLEVDTLAPALTEDDISIDMAKVGASKMSAEFSWLGEEGATYELKVDGKKYSTQDTSYSFDELKDGTHKYELTAVDASLNKTTVKGSFSFDATAPKLSLKKPKLTKAGEGQVSALLSWKGEKGATYTLLAGGTVYELGDATSYTLTLPDGTQSYSVTCTDAAGNATTVNGSFSFDATAPVVSNVSAAYLSMKKDVVQATLTWEGEEGASYTVMVDGKKAYSGKKPTCTLKLKEGVHSYSIVATDKARNSSEALTGSIDTAELLAPPAADMTPQSGMTTTGLDRELGLSAGVLPLPEASTACAPSLCALGLEAGLDEQLRQSSLGTLA